jgi:hypothetical protein
LKTAKTILIFFGVVSSLGALDLSWQPSPPADAVTKYNVYERVGPNYNLMGTVVPPQSSFTLLPLTPTTHTFAVTAVNAVGESLASNEATISPGSGLRIFATEKSSGISISFPTVFGKSYQLQRTTDLVHPIWSVLQTDIPGNGTVTTLNDASASAMSKAFYQVVVILP